MDDIREFRDGMLFVGGWLWLDLVNSTLALPEGPVDYLSDSATAVAWLDAAGLASLPEDGDGGELRALRAILRAAVDGLRAGERPSDAVVGHINRLLGGQTRRLSLRDTGSAIALAETVEPGAAGNASVIAEDFARFLGAHDADRMKRCANPACTMVFYDRGKSRRRRWCSMSLCGNRDKVARYRARHAEQE